MKSIFDNNLSPMSLAQKHPHIKLLISFSVLSFISSFSIILRKPIGQQFLFAYQDLVPLPFNSPTWNRSCSTQKSTQDFHSGWNRSWKRRPRCARSWHSWHSGIVLGLDRHWRHWEPYAECFPPPFWDRTGRWGDNRVRLPCTDTAGTHTAGSVSAYFPIESK